MRVIKLVETSMLASIIFVSMLFINITVFQSALHIGSLAIVIVCLLFDKRQAIFATLIGSILYDITTGLFIYLPFTIVARFLMALIISLGRNKSIYIQLLYTAIASVIVVVIYFISFILFFNDLSTALYASVADSIQIIFNMLAIFIVVPIRSRLQKKNFNDRL